MNLEMKLRKYAPEILAGVAVVGVVATTLSAIKATPKVYALIEHNEDIKNRALTPSEQLIIALPNYRNAIIFGGITISAIISSSVLSFKRMESLKELAATSYILLDTAFKEYREQVVEMFGEEADQKIAGGLFLKKHSNITRDDVLFYEPVTKRYFETTHEELAKAVYELNRKYAIDGEVSLNYFLKLIGLEETVQGNINGWNAAMNWEFYGYAWVDVEFDRITLDDGLECLKLRYVLPPDENYMLY